MQLDRQSMNVYTVMMTC